MRLENKVAIVTGSGAGIGKAIALRYACEGARVVVAEIEQESGMATLSEILACKRAAIFVPTDVAEEDDVRNMVGRTLETYGRIDILVNNAAVLMYGKDTRVHELSQEVWERTLAVNLGGQWAVLPTCDSRNVEARWGLHHQYGIANRTARVRKPHRVQH